MAAQKLNEQQLSSALAQLSNWVVKDEKLHREYKFADFAHAIGFIAAAAPGIEKMNHHPEWANVYGTVPVDLVTTSASGLDPEISPAAAEYQIVRVAAARKMSEAAVRAAVGRPTSGQLPGFLGEPRVNVLALNLDLDAKYPAKS